MLQRAVAEIKKDQIKRMVEETEKAKHSYFDRRVDIDPYDDMEREHLNREYERN
jgi:hypothetical protein